MFDTDGCSDCFLKDELISFLRREIRSLRQEVADLKAVGEARTVSGPTASELWEWVFAGILQGLDYHDHGSQFHIDCENLNAMMKEGGDEKIR